MKSTARFAAFLVLVLTFAIPGFAQTGAIEGKVLDQDGKLIVGMTVAIDRQGIAQHFEIKTDAKGAYFHAGLPTGSYKVTLMKDGVAVTFLQGVRVTFGGVTKADFDLKAMAAQAQAASGVTAEQAAKAEAEKKAADETKASFEAGRAALTAKNWDEAAKQFQMAAEKDPTQHVIYANLADAYSGARKYPEAAQAYGKAIELKPDEAAYYNNLGIVQGNAGKIEEASAALQKAAELAPATAGQAYYNLGAVLTNRGRTRDASEAFKKAIEFKADMAEAYYQLGISYFGSPTTIAEAIPVLQKYLEMAPTSPNAEAAKQLIEAAKASAPTGFKSERAVQLEKEKAEKERMDKEKAEAAAKAKKKR